PSLSLGNHLFDFGKVLSSFSFRCLKFSNECRHIIVELFERDRIEQATPASNKKTNHAHYRCKQHQKNFRHTSPEGEVSPTSVKSSSGALPVNSKPSGSPSKLFPSKTALFCFFGSGIRFRYSMSI